VGKRKTKQRDAIRAAFMAAERPLTSAEAHVLVQAEIPSLGIATIYRAIKDLLEEGWLVSMSIAGTTRYELADLGHHHHFHCNQCDKTFDIEGCVEDLASLVPKAFKILKHELTFIGMCQSCNGEMTS